MTGTMKKELEHMGDTPGCLNHVHDLIHELSRRLDALWRYDQYIANAEGHAFIQEFWSELQGQDRENVRRLKELIAEESKKDSF